MDSKVRQSWDDFLNPDVLRPRLIAVSVYIAGFELLKSSIIERIRDFFCNGFDATGWQIDSKYQSDVLSRNKSVVHASLDWLTSMHAIDGRDVDTFQRIKNCRNAMVHQMHAIVGSAGLPADFDSCFQDMIALLRKVELWWITEVEIPTNPDLDGQQIDYSQIQPGSCISMAILCEIAMGDSSSSTEMLQEFRRRCEAEEPGCD